MALQGIAFGAHPFDETPSPRHSHLCSVKNVTPGLFPNLDMPIS